MCRTILLDEDTVDKLLATLCMFKNAFMYLIHILVICMVARFKFVKRFFK